MLSLFSYSHYRQILDSNNEVLAFRETRSHAIAFEPGSAHLRVANASVLKLEPARLRRFAEA